MKAPLAFLPQVALALIALSTTSCYVSTIPVHTAGGPAGIESRATGTPTAAATTRRTVTSSGLFFGSRSGSSSYRRYGSSYGYAPSRGYGSSYRTSSCGCGSVCSCSRCSCGSSSRSHSHYDHGSSRSSRSIDHSRDKHSHNEYRIAGGSVRPTQTKPTGYHTLDWYKSRGYDTSQLRLVNEHGEPKGSGGSSSRKKKKR